MEPVRHYSKSCRTIDRSFRGARFHYHITSADRAPNEGPAFYRRYPIGTYRSVAEIVKPDCWAIIARHTRMDPSTLTWS
jgi:hypothetical protein